jgi:hypothetical protein
MWDIPTHMFELLAVPAWNVADTPLDAWVDQFRSQGLEVVVNRESPDVCWIEINALRLRGYAIIEGDFVAAINFELARLDDSPARSAVEQAAHALTWDLDDEQEDTPDYDDE